MMFDGPERFDAVAEKDIDMLLLEEFCSNERWCEWFYARLRQDLPDLPKLNRLRVEAGRSVSGIGTDGKPGETDVLVLFHGSTPEGDTGVVVLIEDKVSAPFTQNQPERYRARAESEQAEHRCMHCATVLVAPRRYTFHVPNDAFDLVLTLDEIKDVLTQLAAESEGELRRRLHHRALLLEHVCGNFHRYTPMNVIPHEGNTRMIGAIEQYIQRQEHRLRVKPRSVRGRGSVGPGFDLPSKKSLRDAAKSKWGKARAGCGELNFNWHLGDGFVRIRFHHWEGFGEQLRRWFSSRLPGNAHMTAQGDTLDLEHRGLPRLDTTLGVESQREMIDCCIAAAVELQEWFEQLAPELERLLRTAGDGSQ
jgi:hypothetical protein